MSEFNSERIYRSGYALMVYHPSSERRTWKYRDEEYTLEAGDVPEVEHRALKVRLAKIEDVRNVGR